MYASEREADLDHLFDAWTPERFEAMGFMPGDSIEGKILSMIAIAELTEYWRRQAEDEYRAAAKDNMVRHLRERAQALAKKLRGVRAAAVEYKRCREFDILVAKMQGK